MTVGVNQQSGVFHFIRHWSYCRSQNVPDAQSVIVLPDTLPKEDLKGAKNAAESLNLQWRDVTGGVKVYRKTTEDEGHSS